MDERHYLGVYWGDRKESIDEASAHVHELMRALASLGVDFGDFDRWYVRGETREASLDRELSIGAGAIRDAIRARQDTAQDHEELGFYLESWNAGETGESMQLDFMIGAHAELHHAPSPNSCILQLPRGGAAAARMLDVAMLRRVFEVMARVLSPDWGLVTTDRILMSGAMTRTPGAPFVGWLTFLSEARGRVPKLKNAFRVEPLARGTLITLSEEPLTSHSNSSALEGLEDELRKRGLLKNTGSYASGPAPALPDEILAEKGDAREDATHALASSWFHHVFRSWLDGAGFVLGREAAFAGASPDVAVFFADQVVMPAHGAIPYAPDVAVEIVSHEPPSARDDRVTKIAAHALVGVRNVWLVDPTLQTFEALELGEDGRYVRAVAATGGTLDNLPACGSLALDLDALWAELARLTR